MWVWEHALFNYNPKRPDSTKKDKTVEVITKADHLAALRRAKAEGMRLSKHEYQCWEDAMWSAETKDVVTFGQWIDARAAQIEEGE